MIFNIKNNDKTAQKYIQRIPALGIFGIFTVIPLLTITFFTFIIT